MFGNVRLQIMCIQTNVISLETTAVIRSN